MKAAAVINVGHGALALTHAVKTQALLLEHMGAQLDSIRLAAPRLLRNACIAAIAETPDLLAIAGGPRAARRAGQIAHDAQVPILFLPGLRAPSWATRLWGSLSLEGMIAALATEKFIPARLGVGAVDGHIFFENASCGLLSQVPELRQAYSEADSLSEGWKVLDRAADLVFGPRLQLRCENTARLASALVVTPQGIGQDKAQIPLQLEPKRFSCTAWRHGIVPSAVGLLTGLAGKDWRLSPRAERFDCTELSIESAGATWLLLDGDPVLVQPPVTFRILPCAVETFAFLPESVIANDNGTGRRTRYTRNPIFESRASGNFRRASHVDKATVMKAGRNKRV